MIELSAHGWRLAVEPALGGSVTWLSLHGRDVLRPARPGVRSPLETGCFPLLPFANRIDGGRFTFRGETVQLPALDAFAPHALHGEGWQRAWTVEAAGEDEAVLTCRHEAGDWPWAWSARQSFRLRAGEARIRLVLRNEDERAMPAGIGLHPYFPRPDGARLSFAANDAWPPDADGIPRRSVAASTGIDWSQNPELDGVPSVDQCHGGWPGRAVLTLGGSAAPRVLLEASETARWLHVFTPEGEDFFCVEPVTHRPDALNAPAGEDSGLAVLEPGERLSMSLTLRVLAA